MNSRPLKPVLNAETSAERSVALADPQATRDLAAALAGLLRAGDFVGLSGVLGAGKTTLVRHVIETLAGQAVEAPSPSFTLVQTYDLPQFTLWHFDLYRIEAPEAVYELGFEDALADGVCLVEWPDRLGPLMPADRLDLTLLQGPTPDSRDVRLVGLGSWQARLAALAHV